jgi:hypothetical protein
MQLSLIRPYRGLFLLLSILGFLLINLPFLYFAFFEKAVYDTAMSNGVALVFMSEAFLLMLLVAFLIAKLGLKKPGWLWFIVLSILGSMAFSVPFYLYLYTGKLHSEK